MPERIQLRRTKGWRKPDGAIVVSRPSKWGNPFAVRECRNVLCLVDRTFVLHWHYYDPDAGALSVSFRTVAAAVRESVRRFRDAVNDNDGDRYGYVPRRDEIRADLAGRDLACWCALDAPCHADVLLEIANACDCVGDYYDAVPDGYHIVEDLDGERLVPNQTTDGA